MEPINCVVLDFETTGLDADTGEIVEFALVRIRDGEIGLHMASLCRPLRGIPYSAQRIHGISHDMVMDFPTFEELLPSVLSFIGEDKIVCHNTPFDMGFLWAYCRRAGIEFNPPLGDTLMLARRLFPKMKSKSLQNMALALGIEGEEFHRALSDAMVTAKLYIKMKEMMRFV